MWHDYTFKEGGVRILFLLLVSKSRTSCAGRAGSRSMKLCTDPSVYFLPCLAPPAWPCCVRNCVAQSFIWVQSYIVMSFIFLMLLRWAGKTFVPQEKWPLHLYRTFRDKWGTTQCSSSLKDDFHKDRHVTCSPVSNLHIKTTVKQLSVGGQGISKISYCSEVYCQLCSRLRFPAGQYAVFCWNEGWVVDGVLANSVLWYSHKLN